MKKVNLLMLCTLLYSTNAAANIFQDVHNGDQEAIRKRLDNGEDCTVKDTDGNTVLHIAAQEGHEEIIEIITEYFNKCSYWTYYTSYTKIPNLDEVNDNGDTILHATINGNSNHERRAEIAQYLIAKKPALIEKVNKKNLSPAFAAVRKDDPRFIRLFTAHKLDLHKHKYNGETIFTYSIKEKKPKTMHYCAQETTLINTPNNDKKTPIMLTIDTENINTLELFADHLNITIAHLGIKPIHYATAQGKTAVVDYLLQNKVVVDEPDKDGNPPLFYAVDSNDKEMIKHLIFLGADPKKCNKQGEDILARAAQDNHHGMIDFLMNEYHLDIDLRDNSGQTSFMHATTQRNYEIMKNLLRRGANSRKTDKRREGALHKAARSGDVTAAHIIIQHDPAALHDINIDGNSPLLVALKNNQRAVARFLFDAGSDVNTIDNNGETVLHAIADQSNNELLKETLNKINPSLINHKNKHGKTALFLAAENNNVAGLSMLIHNKVDYLNITDNDGLSPLHCAATHDALETIKELEKHGARLTDCTPEGNTVAHIAAGYGKIKTLKYLQTKDGLCDVYNKKGENAFSYGALQGQLEATKLLLCEEYFINDTVSRTLAALKKSVHHNSNVNTFLTKEHNDRLRTCEEIHNVYVQTKNIINDNYRLNSLLAQDNFFRVFLYAPSQLNEKTINELYHMTEKQRTEIKDHYWKSKDTERTKQINFEREINDKRLEQQKILAKKEADEKEKQERIRHQQQAELDRIAQENRQRAAQEKARLQEELKKQQQTEQEHIAAQNGTTVREQKAELERIAADRERAAAAQYRADLDAHSKRMAEENARAPQAAEQTQAAQTENAEVVEKGDCGICLEEREVKPMPCSNCHKGSARTCDECLKEYIAGRKKHNLPVICPICQKETLSEKLKK